MPPQSHSLAVTHGENVPISKLWLVFPAVGAGAHKGGARGSFISEQSRNRSNLPAEASPELLSPKSPCAGTINARATLPARGWDSIHTRGHFFPRAGGVWAPPWPLPTRGRAMAATAGLLAQPGCGHGLLGPAVLSGL